MNFHGERKSDKLLKTGCPYGGARYRGLFIYIYTLLGILISHTLNILHGFYNFKLLDFLFLMLAKLLLRIYE